MNTFLILFSDGNTVTTGFNGSYAEAYAYYINQSFSFMRADESEFAAIGVSVTQL